MWRWRGLPSRQLLGHRAQGCERSVARSRFVFFVAPFGTEPLFANTMSTTRQELGHGQDRKNRQEQVQQLEQGRDRTKRQEQGQQLGQEHFVEESNAVECVTT